MSTGDLDWILATIMAAGGQLQPAALEAALGAVDGGAIADLRARIAVAPQITRLADGPLALVRGRVAGAYFRFTPDARAIAQGVLPLDGTELGLALACAEPASQPDREVSWRATGEEGEPHRVRLARAGSHDGWVFPGLLPWFEAAGVVPGDDVIVHVRDLATPLLVLDRRDRLERDEGVIARRNHRVLDAAVAALRAETWDGPLPDGVLPGAWLGLERLLKLVVGRYDYRRGEPPDAFGTRLLARDPRLLVSREGTEVRLAHFHTDAAAHAYLARMASPEQALGAFLEEFPPGSPEDRDKALATLHDLWRDTPRSELDGLTPAEVEARAAKIVPFPGTT